MDSQKLNKIKSEFVSGTKTLQEAADEYGIPYSTLTNKSHEGKWKELRKECGKKTEKKLIDTVSSRDAKRAVNINDIADTLLDRIAEIAPSIHDPQSLKQLTSSLNDLAKIKGCKSEADMREQEARIAKLEQEIASDVVEPKSVTVNLIGDLGKYAN